MKLGGGVTSDRNRCSLERCDYTMDSRRRRRRRTMHVAISYSGGNLVFPVRTRRSEEASRDLSWSR